MVIVVKRRGKKEGFDEKKVYASIYSACKDCNLEVKECESIAARITNDVKLFIKDRGQVNSTELFGFVIQKLAKTHEPVAFMYSTHREFLG